MHSSFFFLHSLKFGIPYLPYKKLLISLKALTLQTLKSLFYQQRIKHINTRYIRMLNPCTKIIHLELFFSYKSLVQT